MLAPKSSRDSRESPTFAELGVAVEICDALAENGITHTFAIQELTLPIALNGHDLIGQARTGMGKTYGFGVPLLDRVFDDADIPELDGTPRALVIAPTRELAIQVSGDLKVAAANLPLSVVTLCGGRPYEEQITQIKRGADVVVGTPGRLLDLCQKKHLSFDQVSVLVLDEADEMLDLGFLPDIEKILSLLHGNPHQTMLFSATMPGPIVTLARTFLTKPVHIRAESGDAQQTHSSTRKVTFQAHRMDKIAVLGKILQAEGRGRTIIFTRTKRSAAAVADELAQRGFSVGAVHGDLDQKARERSLSAFREGTVEILVATDVAARGIDVDDVTHVINYQVPDDPMTFVHRIGRTGRAGHTGTAVTLVGYDELSKWQVINDELSLDQPEPPQWFSTSPELAQALDIPEGVSDTVGPPTKVLGAAKRSGSRGGSPRGGSSRSSTASARASRRTRSRKRNPRQGGHR
ncbi:DEAD/DEAH box helicase [Corynebacterium sp. HMSC065D07]|uniref:DEAD/DEAH box helicase n=1 Tax=Corynebacterium sp. HMSC065D07 TaxID=1739264 RepID=UPI0008A14BF5|nr:DEAD/DEAH box helicase [Corynebacterium sp. HMSC065D07]OFL60433.1 DEAD/DEAH box helicase [Corynebacterium sp. HMSC065D07]